MRRNAYSVPTLIGEIELTKGAFLTLKRRKAQNPTPSPKFKHIRKAPTPPLSPSPKPHLTGPSKPTRTPQRAKTQNASWWQMNESIEMEQESTWSNIDMAVYSLSLSLSAANFDHRWKVCA